VAEFDETAGEFIRNLLRSVQEEAERLPSPVVLMDSFKRLDPTPDQLGAFLGKCAEVAAKAATEIARGIREAGATFNDQGRDFDVPDDLSDLGEE
jgi:hypothetical protein